MEEGRSAFKILTGKPIRKRPLGRPRRKWEDSIRKDFKEIGINTRNWMIRLRIGIIGGLDYFWDICIRYICIIHMFLRMFSRL